MRCHHKAEGRRAPAGWLWAIVMIALAPGARAQVYLPETEYHDPVQRFFVVEAARVLAWRDNKQSQRPVAEVKFDLIVRPEDKTIWKLNWLDKDGQSIQQARITYTNDVLTSGAEFYRQAFKQLMTATWRAPGRLTKQRAQDAYWKGAGRMGWSREESLGVAMTMAEAAGAASDDWVPELGGLLVHAALPSTADHLSIDSVVLARGAAWLALAEQCSGAALDDAWAPILFLAGRETAARAVWKPAADPTVQQEGWNLWMASAVTRDLCLFGTDPQNLGMAMPMLAYDAHANRSGGTIAQLLPVLAGTPEHLSRLHNYGPWLAQWTSVEGGQILDGQWPVLSRNACLALLRGDKSDPATLQRVEPWIKQARESFRAGAASNQDPSLQGLQSMAPLLEAGRKEGDGPLIPAGAVTTRDLLNYNWEMAGLQLGSRYHYLAHCRNTPAVAKEVFDTATAGLQGALPFFQNNAQAASVAFAQSMRRLQLVDDFFHRWGFSRPPRDTRLTAQENAEIFKKTVWLRPKEFEWQARLLWDAKLQGKVPDLIQMFLKEGGALARASVLGYLGCLDADSLRQIPGGEAWRDRLAESMPPQTALLYENVRRSRFEDASRYERAQALEKFYWENPDSGLETAIFSDYAISGATRSAIRFHKQARENMMDRATYACCLGGSVYMLGYVLDDEALRRMALQEVDPDSEGGRAIFIWEAARLGDTARMEKLIDEMIERHESGKGADSDGRKLKRFLPLLPALAKTDDPRHKQAVRSFLRDDSWLALRWIWSQQFRLSRDDTVMFLGGWEASNFAAPLVAVAENDREVLAKTFDDLNKPSAGSNTYNIMGAVLAGRALGKAPLPDVDMKPGRVNSALEAVQAAVARRNQQKEK